MFLSVSVSVQSAVNGWLDQKKQNIQGWSGHPQPVTRSFTYLCKEWPSWWFETRSLSIN